MAPVAIAAAGQRVGRVHHAVEDDDARFPFNYFVAPSIPKGARIIVFHGVVNPPDALAGRSMGNWRRALATPWIAEHWRE